MKKRSSAWVVNHGIWHLSLFGRVNLAPVPSNIQTALDIGCGTGSWVIDFAKAHPDCQVTGADLSSIQPPSPPPNVNFVVQDMTTAWTCPHRLSYIHSRTITVAIKTWPALVTECWRSLKPGGWVEFQEYHLPFTSNDDSLKHGPALQLWNESVIAAAGQIGTNMDAMSSMQPLLEEQGFTSLARIATKWPMAPWAKGEREKNFGLLAEMDVGDATEGFGLRLSSGGAKKRSGSPSGSDVVWAQKPHDVVD
ncbi:hypothetical protein LTR08_005965 [Meristemomyces frigidus]|nr:hypothetical protein LTR08_005965 [Meristemomyces frigidus]